MHAVNLRRLSRRGWDACCLLFCRGEKKTRLFFLIFLGVWERLGSVLARSWDVLGPSWDVLGRSWVVLEPSCRHLGAVLGRLGAILEPPWGVHGSSWGCFWPSWGVLKLLLVAIERTSKIIEKTTVFIGFFQVWGRLGRGLVAVLGRLGRS